MVSSILGNYYLTWFMSLLFQKGFKFNWINRAYSKLWKSNVLCCSNILMNLWVMSEEWTLTSYHNHKVLEMKELGSYLGREKKSKRLNNYRSKLRKGQNHYMNLELVYYSYLNHAAPYSQVSIPTHHQLTAPRSTTTHHICYSKCYLKRQVSGSDT